MKEITPEYEWCGDFGLEEYSNYLESIENEFSKIRDKTTLLKPLDWQLAGEWEEKEVPLFIVLQAMGEVAKTFNTEKRPDTINSLAYFKQAVEKRFKEYAASQIGKSETKPEETVVDDTTQNINALELLAGRFDLNYFVRAGITLPEVLQPAIEAINKEILDIIKDVREKQITLTEIEDRLSEMAASFIYSLALSLTEDERLAMVADIDQKHKGLDDDGRASMATKKLYEKYGLPELTLFEF